MVAPWWSHSNLALEPMGAIGSHSVPLDYNGTLWDIMVTGSPWEIFVRVGVVLGCQLSMSRQVAAVCRSCFCQIRRRPIMLITYGWTIAYTFIMRPSSLGGAALCVALCLFVCPSVHSVIAAPAGLRPHAAACRPHADTHWGPHIVTAVSAAQILVSSKTV